MAKYESEGFCPDNVVMRILVNHPNQQLCAFWSIIGASVVCGTEVNCDSVVAMFSDDAIALKLMKSILCYNNRAGKVRILMGATGSTELCTSTIQDVLTSGDLTNPILILSAGSNFAVIISEEDKATTLVHMWDLQAGGQ